MTQVVYINSVKMATTRSQAEDDPGDVLLVCQCLGPGEDDQSPTTVLGALTLAMTYHQGLALAQMLADQFGVTQDSRYRGPTIRRTS